MGAGPRCDRGRGDARGARARSLVQSVRSGSAHGPWKDPAAVDFTRGRDSERRRGGRMTYGWTPDKRWNEECGVFAAVGVPNAAEVTCLGLHALQHRGQEAAGVVSCDDHGEFHTHKGLGLVSDVFRHFDGARLPGALAIGHNRYSTTGALTRENTQPLQVVYRNGPLALAHNGNLVNARDLRKTLEA